MIPARAFRTNDTTPPPGAILHAGESVTVVTSGLTKPDWTEPDAYLPNNNLTTIAASASGNCIFVDAFVVHYARVDSDHLSPIRDLVRNNLVFGQSCLFQKPDGDQMLLWLDKASKAASARGVSIIYNSMTVSDILKPASFFYGGSAHIITPFKGYEEFHSADWDGQGAEAITPETLAYARKLMKIMPTTLGNPDAAPAGDGSIALEWVPEDLNHRLDRLFLDIGPGEVWRAYWSLRNGEFERVTHEGFTEHTQEALQKIFQLLGS